MFHLELYITKDLILIICRDHCTFTTAWTDSSEQSSVLEELMSLSWSRNYWNFMATENLFTITVLFNPIINQLNPIHILTHYLFMFCCNIILPSTPRSTCRSFDLSLTNFSFPHARYTPLPSSLIQYLVQSANCEARQYVNGFIILLVPLSWV